LRQAAIITHQSAGRQFIELTFSVHQTPVLSFSIGASIEDQLSSSSNQLTEKSRQ